MSLTPEPWEVEGSIYRGFKAAVSGGVPRKTVAQVPQFEDARLIAAAPDLLRACRLLLSQYDSSGDFRMGGNLTNEPFLLAKAAVAKVYDGMTLPPDDSGADPMKEK